MLWLVGLLVFEHAEGDLHELAHRGPGGAHLEFAGLDEALIKGAWLACLRATRLRAARGQANRQARAQPESAL